MTRDGGRTTARRSLLVPLLAMALLLVGGRARAASAACLPLPTPLPPGQADQRFWGPELIAEVAARGPAPDFGTSQQGRRSVAPLSAAEIVDPAPLRAALEWMLGGPFRDTCAPLNPLLKQDPGLTAAQMQAAHVTQTGAGFFASPVAEELGYAPPASPPETDIQVFAIEFDGIVGERSYAYLLVPRGATNAPRELAIARHQTLAECASREQIGACVPGEGIAPAYGLGVELARRGYIVLAGPDMPGYGRMRAYPDGNDTALEYDTVAMREIRRFFPDTSVLLAEQLRTRRAIDAVLALQAAGDYVVSNPARLVMSGHSKGAYGALLYAALDPDVATVIASAGPLSVSWRDDDVGVDEPYAINGRTGFAGRWCGWGYMPNVCRFAEPGELPLDVPGLVRLGLGPGRSLLLTAIEDDLLPYRKRWSAVARSGRLAVRTAAKSGGHVSYEIVASGFRDRDAARACGLTTRIPMDQPILQAVRHCQLASGLAYPHGIYFGPLNRFFAAIEQGDLPVGGRVIRTDGAP